MKKQILVLGLLSVVVSGALLFPKEGSAFWIFDKFFGDGEVKGEQTDKPQKSIRNIFIKTETTPTPTEEKILEVDEELTEEAIEKASVGKRISAAQKKAMLARLAAIRAKKAELKKLQDAFKVWMKENKIDPAIIKSLNPSVTPTKNTETKKNEPKRKATPTVQNTVSE